MQRLDCNEYLPFLTPEQRRRLNALLSDVSGGARFYMPHELINVGGIGRLEALALMNTLESLCSAVNYLLVYHECPYEDSDNLPAVASFPLREGLPPWPWCCPSCGTEITARNELELTYDSRLLLSDSVELI